MAEYEPLGIDALCDACLMNESISIFGRNVCDALQIVRHASCQYWIPDSVVTDCPEGRLALIDLCEDHEKMFADWTRVYFEECA